MRLKTKKRGYLNMNKPVMEVAAIHDLSGYGRASLTVAIPVLSAMGIQVCPLPTSILSTQTSGFSNYSFFDFTDRMTDIINHWKTLDIKFDAVYTGFLGSDRQISIIRDFITDFRAEKQLIVVDPVMGDDGNPYDTIDKNIISGMKSLVAMADLITPNITEASMLTGEELRLGNDKVKKELLIKLSEIGPEKVVITSVPESEGKKSVIAYERNTGFFWKMKYNYVEAYYPGTGDIFTSVLTGSLLNGESLPVAINKAVNFISLAIKTSFGYNIPRRNGVMFERVISTLSKQVKVLEYEAF